MGTKDGIAAKIESDKDSKMQLMEHNVVENKEKVIERLLSLVYNIKPEVHQNMRVGG